MTRKDWTGLSFIGQERKGKDRKGENGKVQERKGMDRTEQERKELKDRTGTGQDVKEHGSYFNLHSPKTVLGTFHYLVILL